ncbi:hypothetical protein ACQP2Y_18905 [Actinoplanes sp. CA-051413]|uniref:hypothetical protein n=1 Tax=Actinoplanes sp. CA-051413 TaxID=3239899 RepID=UPI003D957BEE
MELERIGTWILDELPGLNRAILAGEAPPDVLVDALGRDVLPGLPRPERLDQLEAQRLLVHLGFVGASVARHFQERTPGGKEEPQRAFDGLTAGDAAVPFPAYFTALADHTGTGHYHRDSYASLVRWNVGTIQVCLGDEVLASLPGVFDDGRIRSYTGTPAEERFFALVKRSEALELAVNNLLEPLAGADCRLDSEDAILRLRTSATLLEAMRHLFLTFAALPADQSMPAEHFMDVFRQFAVHWLPDDIPPSGALDPEALKRDFLLGIALPDYARHVRRLFPALLADERTALEALMVQPTLPQRLLTTLEVDADALATADLADLGRLVSRAPALADWYALLNAHARAAGAHLMLSKKFLFKPQTQRDLAGQGDQRLVSNRSGTTGMTETFLERLTRARREHLLAPLRPVLSGEITANATTGAVRSPSGTATVAVTLAA